MPHSSGGGSHGGGYHSSSSSSSRSYSSSSRSSSGSSYGGSYSGAPSISPISHVYYPGAIRYVYYGSNGDCHTLYQKGSEHAKPDLGTTIIAIIIVSVIAFPLLWLLWNAGAFIPRKVDVSSYNANIVIEDTVGLTAGSDLPAALETFREKTGIAPGVEIVRDTAWQGNYTDLQTFAFSEYLRLYDDEKHWLIVLSWPQDAETAGFIAWSWEGMLGDDTSRMINTKLEDRFTEIIHKHLLRSTKDNVGEELAKAYNEFSATCMDKQFRYGWLFVMLLLAALYGYLVFYYIRDYRDAKNILKAVAVGAGAKEYNCEYCGAMYVAGTVSICPRCGAPIPARSKSKESEKKKD